MNRFKHTLNQIKFALGGTQPVTGPVKAFWEITHRCNSRCLNCDIWQKNPGNELTTEQALNLIDQLKELNVPHISYSGGEPLLRKDFFKLLEYTKKLGFKVSVNTNGWLINDEKAKNLCRLGIESIYLSLDGATPEINDKIRGMNGSYQKVLSALDLLNSYKTNSRTKVYINATINRLNVNDIPRIADLAVENGADGLTMTVVQNVDIYRPIPEMLLTDGDIGALNRNIHAVQEKYPKIFPHMTEYFKNFENSILQPESLYKYRCVAGYLTLMVHPNGDIFSCPVAFEKVGNVLEEPLEKIWYHNLKGLRKRIKMGKHPICWFDCMAPINILMSYLRPSRFYKLFNPKLVKYLRHKYF